MIEVQRPVRPVPAWVTALVVVVAVGGGGWFLYAMWQGSGPMEQIVVLDRGPGDGVVAKGEGRWTLKANNCGLGIEKDADGQPIFNFYYEKQDFLGPEVTDTLIKVRRVVTDPAMARELQITPQQMKALQDVRKGAKIELSEPDKTRLKGLWNDYESAGNKAGAELKLIKATEEIGRRLEASVKQSAVARAETARAILTPEQWQQLDPAGKD